MSRLLLTTSFIVFTLLSFTGNTQQTAIIKGRRYTASFDNERSVFSVIKGIRDTVLKLAPDDYVNFKFRDFNKDGCKDIFLEWAGNMPEKYSLYLFAPSSGKFRELKNFSDFPAPTKIKGTDYYYSYGKNGCADEAWNSYLFYIKNFNTIKIGKIHGDGCGVRDGVYIYKCRSKKEQLIKTLPLNTILNYKDYKWGFIKKYWKKNWQIFVN